MANENNFDFNEQNINEQNAFYNDEPIAGTTEAVGDAPQTEPVAQTEPVCETAEQPAPATQPAPQATQSAPTAEPIQPPPSFAQPQNTYQPAPCRPKMRVICPRCSSVVDFANFCPNCGISLNPSAAGTPPTASQQYGYAPYQPQQPAFQGYQQPAYAPPMGRQMPMNFRQPAQPKKNRTGMWVGLGIGIALFIAVIGFSIWGVISFLNYVDNNPLYQDDFDFYDRFKDDDSSSSPYNKNDEDYIPPFGESSGSAQNQQYVIGDEIVINGLSYTFNSCRIETKEDKAYAVISVSIKNQGEAPTTVTSDRFKLLGSDNEYRSYLAEKLFKGEPLKRVVVTPAKRLQGFSPIPCFRMTRATCPFML